MQDLQEIKQFLTSQQQFLQNEYKAEILGIFGSFSRKEASSDSDIDLLVHFGEGATLIDLSGLGLYLEEKLHRKVDIVSDRALRAELKPHVEKDLIPL